MSHTVTRRAPVAIALLVAALVLGACGGGGGGGDANTAVKGRQASGGGPVQNGGTLTLGSTQGVEQLDPNTINSAAQQQLLTLLWNGLTKWGQGMTTEPDLAASWTHSADNKTWTFKLRSGVHFHDGRAFTAQDAVKNIERVLDPKVPSQARVKIDMIKHVQAVDPTTLKLTLSRPNAALPTALIDVKMTDVDHVKQINKTANGTGPYKLKKFVPGDTVDLVRNPDYFGEKAHLDEIKIVRSADETSAESAFRSGDLDALWAVPPSSLGALVKGDKGNVLESPAPSSAAVWELDTTSPPFDDPRARLALAYAADRKTMFEAAYAGHGTVDATDSIINPRSRFFADGLQQHAFDLDKAKQLFTQAGVKQGATLTFWTAAGAYPEWTTMGEILQQDLAKIGIKLQIKKSEISAWSQRFYPAPKKYPGLVVANFLSFPPLPATYSLQWFGSKGTCECNWKPPSAYDDAVQTADTSASAGRRQQAYDTMQKLLNQNVPVVVLGNTAILSVANPKVRGAWVQSDGGLHLESAGLATSGAAG